MTGSMRRPLVGLIALLTITMCSGEALAWVPFCHDRFTDPALQRHFFCPWAIAEVDQASADQDSRRYFAREHFDRRPGDAEGGRDIYAASWLAFQRGQSYLEDLRARLDTELGAGDFGGARRTMAEYLHAAQDFYVHSNACDLSDSDQEGLLESLLGAATTPMGIEGRLKLGCYNAPESASPSACGIVGSALGQCDCDGDLFPHGRLPMGHILCDPAFAIFVPCHFNYALAVSRRFVDMVAGSPHLANPEALCLWRGGMWDDVKKTCKCTNCLQPCGDPRRATVAKAVEELASGDPNDKSGPTGGGAGRFIRPGRDIAYTIKFENRPDQSAPAQQVTVVDVLDTSLVDMASVRFGPITIGSTVVVPAADGALNTEVDLRPGRNVIVAVHAWLHASSGRVQWEFQTLDPTTGLPTDDPRGGFLPPNVVPPEGEGAVSVYLTPKASLAGGGRLDNLATIVFDANEPIQTPLWSNAIDGISPASQVAGLLPSQATSEFTVQWQGSDVGSGVESFDVYVSEDGGPLVPWLVRHGQPEAVFPGVPGHRYGFVALARDSAGNTRALPNAPDAETVVDTSTTAALLDLVRADADVEGVSLEWYTTERGLVVGLYRSSLGSEWEHLLDLTPDGTGRLVYRDLNVIPGGRYGYRLLVQGSGESYGETWVVIPKPVLELYGARPNPSVDGLKVEFSLDSRSSASLELFDMAGRRAANISVGHLGPGRHAVDVGSDRALRPGIYLVRLTQGKRSFVAKTIVIR